MTAPSQAPHVAAAGEAAWWAAMDLAASARRDWPAAECGARGRLLRCEDRVEFRVERCGDIHACARCARHYLGDELREAEHRFKAVALAAGTRARCLALSWEFTIPAEWSSRIDALDDEARRDACRRLRKAAHRALADVYGTSSVGALLVNHTWHSSDPVIGSGHYHVHGIVAPVAVDAENRVHELPRWLDADAMEWVRAFWTRRARSALRHLLPGLALPSHGLVVHYAYIRRNEHAQLAHRLGYCMRPVVADAERWLRKQQTPPSAEEAWWERLKDLRKLRRWWWYGCLGAGREVTHTGPRNAWSRTVRVLEIPWDATTPKPERPEPAWTDLGDWRVASLAAGRLELTRPKYNWDNEAVELERISLAAWSWDARGSVISTGPTSLGGDVPVGVPWVPPRSRWGPSPPT